MLLRIILLPLRLAALPVIVLLLLLHLVCSILLGLSSVFTRLLSGVFLLGAAAGWMCRASSGAVWQAAGIGVFFLLAPYAAEWLLGRVTDLTVRLMDFAFSK